MSRWKRAAVHATELIRLQCYEGLDQSSALYEWNYQRQLLAIQAHRGGDADRVGWEQGCRSGGEP